MVFVFQVTGMGNGVVAAVYLGHRQYQLHELNSSSKS